MIQAETGQNHQMNQIFNFIQRIQTDRQWDLTGSCDISALRRKRKNLRTNEKEWFQPRQETVQMLRWMLDYTTHLNSYPLPLAPELALFTIANDDMYVPRNGVLDVRDLWKGILFNASSILLILILILFNAPSIFLMPVV